MNSGMDVFFYLLLTSLVFHTITVIKTCVSISTNFPYRYDNITVCLNFKLYFRLA